MPNTAKTETTLSQEHTQAQDSTGQLRTEGREGKEEMVISDPQVFFHSCKSYILST